MTTLVRREMSLVKREPAPPVPPDGSVAQPEPESRVRDFVASTEAVDSYNTVIKADAWQTDRFDRNPVIFFGHRSRELPIGKGTCRSESKQLLLAVDFFRGEVNPLSEQALRILDEGVMGCSVGFEPLSWEYNKERETGDEFLDYWFPPLDYTAVRLLEVSVVSLPANPDSFPVGREAVQARFMERLEAKRMGPPVIVPPAAIIPAAPALPVSRDELATLVTRITREVQQAAADARRRGKTTRS